MNRRIFWIVSVGVLWLFMVTSPSGAETSQTLLFTGCDPSLESTTIDLRFRIYNVTTGGGPLFEETHPVTADANGCFSVRLGSRTEPDGLPATIFIINPSLWIAFALESTPDTQLGPRTPITAAGFAFQALNAETARQSQSFTPGTAIAASVVEPVLSLTNMSGPGMAATGTSAGVTGTATAASGTGGLFKNTAPEGDLIQGWNSGPSAAFRVFNNGGAFFNGNVGIGTTTPQWPLHVAKQSGHAAVSISSAGTGPGNAATVRFGDGTNDLFTLGLDRAAGGAEPFLYTTANLDFRIGMTVGEVMRIKSNGNVGIGTTSPTSKVDIVESRVNASALSASRGSGRIFLVPNLSQDGYTSLARAGDLGLIYHGEAVNTGSLVIGQWSNSARGIRIDASGNVGIGTRDPQAKLDVNGQAIVNVLQIRGGADLAEGFAVRGAPTLVNHLSPERIEPGMVVSIDPENPGQLRVSRHAYDRRVAGIISGAGGIQPGMLMSQSGTLADGEHPVALSGRVYGWADASYGPITPGDMLTTSDTPGHAMKVTRYGKAQGAILGKAMTGLAQGRGLVLVLVTLQ